MKTQSVFEKLNLKLICEALCFGLSGMCRGSCPFPLRLHEGLLRNRSRWGPYLDKRCPRTVHPWIWFTSELPRCLQTSRTTLNHHIDGTHVPHCISLTPVRSSGSFHRAYRSLSPDFCFFCHSCARRVLDISARLATEERRDGRWEDYGIFLERTIWFHRRSRVSKVNWMQSRNRRLVNLGPLL